MTHTGNPVAAHLEPVTDFERIRPGMTVIFYHGPSNQDQSATVVAWTPIYHPNAVGEVICTEARAVLHVQDLGLGNGWTAGETTLRLTMERYLHPLKMAYRSSVWP